ncbi:hypothetical protein FH972_020895 [Carpinus fangiana]|uniref:RING-type domain-containing protein n=1 Tax=Carpinus fangiana TaxID=176857 RepID=A0A5N6RXQ9_9ROSI|nr:hypothetical protein FH972_020895 [Carpinus fangiana]
MAGMLPGVECARRRRFHQSSGMSDSPSHGGTRRSSLCLYTSSHESHHSSTSPMREKSLLSKALKASQDEELESGAREAKGRLDERLKAQRKSETKWRNNKDRLGSMFHEELQLGSKQSRSKKFSWAKLSWKASDQNICTVCI